jgi:hypothetical protein
MTVRGLRHRRQWLGAPCALSLSLVALAVAGPARAYDPATTHAGLTEKSVLASGLHRVLARRLARPLGLFEPVTLRRGDLDTTPAGRLLLGRLATLDPAGGYRPGKDGVAPAVAWVVAGAVVAQVPAERAGNLFYDPSRGSGLHQAGGLTEAGYSLRLLLDDKGSLRSLSTGTSFNMTGLPATEWLVSPDNDVGLKVFFDALDAAVSAEERGARGTAMARALLALGGTLSVLQDAGEPAHVRNDFRVAYLGTDGENPFDRGSAFERFVADTYGRSGVPAPAAAVDRPTVLAYITGADAQGLADRTQRRFFSDGTVPEDAVVDRDTPVSEVMTDARASLPYGMPVLPELKLSGPLGRRRYVLAPPEPPSPAPRKLVPRRLLAYERVPGRVRFFLDDAVYADTARVLLPEIAAYGAGLVDHLFRAEIRLDVAGGTARVGVQGARGGVRKGEVRIYAEDARGRRVLIGAVPGGAATVGEGGVSGPAVSIPAGTRRLGAVLRGEDDAGDLVAVAEQPLP